jgi:polysaccharide biosynthesis protein PslG
VPSDDNTTVKATVMLRQTRFQEPVWVDLITGGIYEIPATMLATDGDSVTFKDIPLYDAPIVITDRSHMMK